MEDMSAGDPILGATVIIPTFNERDNIAALVSRVSGALVDRDVEILFVDDSSDDTPDVIRRIAAGAPVPVRLLHRDKPVGGLGGAVVEGEKASPDRQFNRVLRVRLLDLHALLPHQP